MPHRGYDDEDTDISPVCDENGYPLYDRWGRQDRIEVWRKADRKLVHIAEGWLEASQWAHSQPHGHLAAETVWDRPDLQSVH